MKKFLTLIFCIAIAAVAFAQEKPAAEAKQQLPPARKIPGLTAEDKFPNACTDCHVNHPDMKFDARLSTMMTQWFNKTDPEVVKKAQGAAPSGVVLKGVHPHAEAAWKNIPSACLGCHRARTDAPRFDNMIHLIHLTGGESNHFITAYQGECTNCHKLDVTTGEWKVPSGPEK